MEAAISSDEQMTPHLFADESLMIGRPHSSKRACRASGVTKRLAPSTITLAEGVPSGSRKSRQLEPLMAEGRPPAGMKASATTRLCIELRAWKPSSVSTVVSSPLGERAARSRAERGRDCSKRRSSSAIGRPAGSSAHPDPSAMPTTRTLSPYSRCRIWSMLPATSPSGPPVSLTDHGSVRGERPSALSATSRKTATPSDVTPNSLWLMPSAGLDDMNAAGRA
mmetsp:Transcript_27188/g.79407  ORF Transcript_27188/g.79407 Transcript_27188/m.79407 type:complete len:223 (-) Transcript_27188:1962-2630(-)